MHTLTTILGFLGAGALTLSLAGASRAESAPPREVVLGTEDGLKIAAAFHPAAEAGGVGVVLLPMFKTDRLAWDGVLEPLAERGVSLLAVDPRGHGRSAEQGGRDLGALVARRDEKLFQATYRDALAAVDWLGSEGGCDPEKIVLVGAGVGFSVAADAAARRPGKIAALAALSPVGRTLGLDTLASVGKIPAATPMLLLVHAEDVDQGAEAIVAARPGARLVVWDDPRPTDAGRCREWAQGTQMLDRLPHVELALASFVLVATGSKREDVVLDGIVVEEGPNADPWDDAVDVAVGGGRGQVRAFRVGRRVLFGGVARPGIHGLQFEVQTGGEEDAEGILVGPPQVVAFDLASGEVTWSWGGMSSMPMFPGMDAKELFGKTLPSIRRVVTEDGTMFEGEWTVPPLGEASDRIRLAVGFRAEPPPRPAGGMVSANPQHAVDLPAR